MQRVLLVNHHSGMHSDLCLLFEEADNQTIEIDEVETGNEALALINNSAYNLLILDLTIPNTDMLGLLGKIKVLNPTLPVLLYSFSMEYTFVKRYLASGVNGYCFIKETDKDEIRRAILSIISGKWYISPEMVELIVEEALFNKTADRLDNLDEREFEIFTHLVKGEAPESVALTLGVHLMTVSLYRSRILDKLRIKNLPDMKQMMHSRSIPSV
jgi:two-component system invasion response regulator UvrY